MCAVCTLPCYPPQVFTGNYFGPAGELLPIEATGRQVGAAGGATVHTHACAVVGAGHTSVRCVSPAGVGTQYFWSLSVAGQSSAPSSQFTSYGPPAVTQVTVDGPGIVDGDEAGAVPTAGGATVTLTGTNFGPDGSRILVTWDDMVVPIVALTVPHFSLSFTSLPGQGAGANVTVSVGGQRAVTVVRLPFGAPRVTLLRLGSGSDGGVSLNCGNVDEDGRPAGGVGSGQRAVLVIRGVNFGRGNATAVTIRNSTCVLQAPVEDTQIVCLTELCTGAICAIARAQGVGARAGLPC
jgi:hypothetical protein